jgi:hypothetical protein
VLAYLDVAIGFVTVMLGMSLIITALTQAIMAILGMRGWDLKRGLEELVTRAAPSLEAKKKKLAAAMLKHPLVSDSVLGGAGFWRLANAIKREELIPILDDVLKRGMIPGLNVKSVAELGANEREAFEQWFDSTMARVSQWFVMHSRWVAVALAVLLAFATHLDASDLLARLSREPETRARLVAMTNTLLDQTPAAVDATRKVSAVYYTTLQAIIDKSPERFTGDKPVSEAIRSRSDAVLWIRQHAKEGVDQAALVKEFNDAVEKALGSELDQALDRMTTVKADLDRTGLSLIPTAAHLDSCGLFGFGHGPAHFGGIIASILLLTLGAPFWFNTLKSLSSLKPVVAQVASGEQPAPGATGAGAQAQARAREFAAALPARPLAPAPPARLPLLP